MAECWADQLVSHSEIPQADKMADLKVDYLVVTRGSLTVGSLERDWAER